MKFAKGSNILGFISVVLYLSFFLIPDPNINSFPFIEMLGMLLFATFIIISLIGVVTAILQRKKLTALEKIFPFVGVLLLSSTIFIDTYAVPLIELKMSYIGKHPTINVGISYKEGASGFPLEKGESYSINIGRISNGVSIIWGENHVSWLDPSDNQQEKYIDLSDDIPKFGSDRIIEITISDQNVRYDVIKKERITNQ
jgi:hypothetical protein